MINLESILQIVLALGSLDTLKWAYRTITNKKNDKRINESEADMSEFHVLQEVNQYLQEALKNKEARFVDQTTRLRATQDELFAERKKRFELEIKLQNAETWRCNIKLCGKREPPNGM